MPAPSGIAGYWFRRGDGGLVWETEVGSKQPRVTTQAADLKTHQNIVFA